MKYIRRIFSDLSKGKNIGPYVLLLVAIPLAVFNIFGKLQAYSVPVTLAILAILLNDAIGSNHRMEEFEERIKELPRSNRALVESGLVTMYSQRRTGTPVELMESRSDLAKESIRILQTWIPGMTPLPNGLIESAKRGVKIKILLLQPKSDIARQRALDMQWNVNKPVEAFEDLIWVLKQKQIRHLPNVEVRFFNALPPFMIYSVDNWTLFSVYWHPDGSSTGPNIEVDSAQGYFGSYINRTFDTIWNLETTLSLDDMEKAMSG